MSDNLHLNETEVLIKALCNKITRSSLWNSSPLMHIVTLNVENMHLLAVGKTPNSLNKVLSSHHYVVAD